MKVFVLGHRGMLGHVAARFLREQGFEVITSDLRYAGEPLDPLIRSIPESGADWVINCIGKIKQKSQDKLDLFLANGILPIHIQAALRENQKLIHASTDCVFSGSKGGYRAADPRDAQDHYGLSKIIGEAVAGHPNCLVIRTSIVGPEVSGGSGLMGWFLSQRGPVRGFTNHQWNGITTLEWCRIALEVMTGKLPRQQGLLQVGSAAPVSKFELLQLFAEIWPHRIEIAATQAPDAVDRTLHPDLRRQELRAQLEELSHWHRPQGTCK